MKTYRIATIPGDGIGPEIVAAHPQPNENAWLLGLVAVRQERLRTQRVMELVGARGIAPP